MSNKILVTGDLFILNEHVKRLQTAGYEVERLEKPKASEEELVEAVKGKAGYIIGGVEKVTDKVIEVADELKAIVFTSTAWQVFIPGHELATQKGIAIANAPHANAGAVAEWVYVASLAMLRDLFALGRTGTKTFQTTKSLSQLQVGIIGLGHVGNTAAEMYKGAGAAKVVYWNRSEKESPFEHMELDELLQTSDIVCVSVGHGAGKLLTAEKLALMKNGTIVSAIETAVDEDALLPHLQNGRLKACFDWTPKNEAYQRLPLDVFYCSNDSTAYNTEAANKLAGDWAIQSMINLLTTGADEHRVN